MTLTEWALRHGIPAPALADLRALLAAPPPCPDAPAGKSEAYAQSLVRLAAPNAGMVLWRNNVGQLMDAHGRPVRYGLANDSKTLNVQLKSSDLVGWQGVVIRPEHVGQKLARFISIECKAPGWSFTGSAREMAQLRWIELVRAHGGTACFSTGGIPE